MKHGICTVLVYDDWDTARLLRADATPQRGHILPELAIAVSQIFED